MALKQGEQILRTRDDPSPIYIRSTNARSDPQKPFRLADNMECPWVADNEPFGPSTLRPRIEPWLTALVQSEHLSLLIGSGLTHAVHRMATGKALSGMDTVTFNAFNDEITAEGKRVAEAAGRKEGNFEDQIRAANELLRGLEIVPPKKEDGTPDEEKISELRKSLVDTLESFSASILQGERNLVSSEVNKRTEAFNYLVSFLMSFASRSGTRERLNVLTTNYDRYIEAGADAAGLRLVDRFIGTLAPVFRASRLDVDLHYNPPGIRGEPRYLEGVARYTKLHGSVDWIDYEGSIRRIGLPFGAGDIDPFLTASGLRNIGARQLMVYPNSAKDRETTYYPYVELFRDLASAVCRPNSTLICYGYSFGDDHINRVIEDMLTIPSTHLVIIAYGDPLDRIMKTYERIGRNVQVTILLGDHLGDLGVLVDRYLPKPAIDRTTFRMADLLRARWSAFQDGSDAGGSNEVKGEDPES